MFPAVTGRGAGVKRALVGEAKFKYFQHVLARAWRPTAVVTDDVPTRLEEGTPEGYTLKIS